jgi:MFS superfamily sulfate permease-like transporter
VLATMLVPVGIAYAEASGVSGIYGLYATIVPLIAYAVFGPSRILVLGPGLGPCAHHPGRRAIERRRRPGRAIALAAAMAIVAGVVCIAAGLLKLGFITELLSKPIRYGYMNGIALTVLLSQAPKLFGFSVDEQGPLRERGPSSMACCPARATKWRFWSAAAPWRRSCCCSAGRGYRAF